jgi:hypothetical protein
MRSSRVVDVIYSRVVDEIYSRVVDEIYSQGVRLERLTANDEVASIPAFSDTVKSERRQIKQC